MFISVDLDSTCIKTAAYDPDKGQMFLTFGKGGTYRYDDVPFTAYKTLINAPSVGREFHASVRNSYTATRVVT